MRFWHAKFVTSSKMWITNSLLQIIAILCLGVSIAQADPTRFLRKNEDALQARMDIIAQAKELITVEYFTIDQDEVSLAGLSLLRQKAREGVEVRILVDGLSQKMDKAVLSLLLSEPRFQVRFYHPFQMLKPKNWMKRLHDKTICVDHRICVVGGRNISNKYFFEDVSGTKYNDLDIVYGGPTARENQNYTIQLFNSKGSKVPYLGSFDPNYLDWPICRTDHFHCPENWQEAEEARAVAEVKLIESLRSLYSGRYGLVPDKNRDWLSEAESGGYITFLHDNPLEKKGLDGITRQLRELVQLAEKNITIISPYVVLSDEAYKLFRHLRARNVSIQIITNSLNSSDNMMAQAAYQKITKKQLIGLGVDLWEYKGPDTVHAKAAVIDNKRVLVGSYNFDLISRQNNREIGITFESPERASELLAIAEEFRSKAYQIGSNLKATNDDGHYGEAAKWKMASIKLLDPLKYFVRDMAKVKSSRPVSP